MTLKTRYGYCLNQVLLYIHPAEEKYIVSYSFSASNTIVGMLIMLVMMMIMMMIDFTSGDISTK